jgi:hypothetical protein
MSYVPVSIISLHDVMARGDDKPADVHLIARDGTAVFLQIELPALRNLRDALNDKYPKAKDPLRS